MKSVFADTFHFLALLKADDPYHMRAALFESLSGDSRIQVVRLTPDLLERGVVLFRSRADKSWPLTDCISFVVMQDHGLTEALTADRHFEQAGFKAMLA